MKKMVKEYVKAKNLTFLNVLDTDSKVAAQYRVRGIPATFFINPGGRLSPLPQGIVSGIAKWAGRCSISLSRRDRRPLDEALRRISDNAGMVYSKISG